MILGDAKYQEIISQLLTHDLTGLDVYLVGSILRGDARDIDMVITGEWDYEKLSTLFESLKSIVELDMCWQPEPPFAWGHNSQPIRSQYAKWVGLDAPLRKKSRGQLKGGFVLRYGILPTIKSKARKYEVAEPLMIIQNGEQIYF